MLTDTNIMYVCEAHISEAISLILKFKDKVIIYKTFDNNKECFIRPLYYVKANHYTPKSWVHKSHYSMYKLTW